MLSGRSRRSRRRWGPAACIALASLLAAGCATDGLAFRHDRRVRILSPPNRARVTLPMTVRWEARGLDAVPGARFGVFVDVAPQPPGEPLSYFARDDQSCRRAAGCPSPAYLADRGVHQTVEPSFVIPALAPVPGVGKSQGDRHEVVVVLLDDEGRRVGEPAASVVFTVVPHRTPG